MAILLFFISIWYLSLFFQTFFQHRYGAHGAFKMSKGWEKVFFVFTWLMQGSSYMSPRAYAIMHRLHHAHTDTELDPHSPSFSKNIFAMMWRTRIFYRDIFEGTMVVEPKYLKNLPEWPAFDRMANSAVARLLWMAAYTAFFIRYAPNAWWYLLLPVVYAMGAFHGAIVNWFAHKYGYINFRLRNTSQNLLFIDFLMLGESYHNNHHKRPSAINFGKRWHEIDPVYPVIRLLGWMRIITIPKVSAVSVAAPPGRRSAFLIDNVAVETNRCNLEYLALYVSGRTDDISATLTRMFFYSPAAVTPALSFRVPHPFVRMGTRIRIGFQPNPYRFPALTRNASGNVRASFYG